jgi:hypothetical protein
MFHVPTPFRHGSQFSNAIGRGPGIGMAMHRHNVANYDFRAPVAAKHKARAFLAPGLTDIIGANRVETNCDC